MRLVKDLIIAIFVAWCIRDTVKWREHRKHTRHGVDYDRHHKVCLRRERGVINGTCALHISAAGCPVCRLSCTVIYVLYPTRLLLLEQKN